MKACLCLLVLLPLAAATADEKRLIADDLQQILSAAQQIVQKLGANETEQQCEGFCPQIIPHLSLFCHPVCQEAQKLAKQLQIPIGVGK